MIRYTMARISELRLMEQDNQAPRGPLDIAAYEKLEATLASLRLRDPTTAEGIPYMSEPGPSVPMPPGAEALDPPARRLASGLQSPRHTYFHLQILPQTY